MSGRALAGVLAALACAAAPGWAAGAQPATPIPGPLDGPLPRFTGAPATAQPLRGPWVPQNPALSPDGTSGTGLAAGNGSASPFPGPLGRGTARASALQFGNCGALAFDAKGRVLALCTSPLAPALRLLDPVSLATLASLSLPARPRTDRTDLAGGTHFLQRADGTLLVPTNDRRLLRVAVRGDALAQTGAVDLGPALGSQLPLAVAAGFDGRDWVAGTGGTVVTVPREGGALHSVALGEPIAEDLATDPSGTYAVTSAALYRLKADGDGVPRVVWRLPIPAGLADAHAGRFHAGSGTPPAILPRGFVAVADATDPPRITVARIAGPDSRRLYCSVPVFKPGQGSIEAALTVAGHSIVATNQYGYDNLLVTEGGRSTTGGIARVVVGRRGCRVAWTSDLISPSAQPVVSRATGLLYTLLKPRGFPDAWNLGAIDWRTGALRFQALAGEGLGFNSDGSPLALGPDGTAYAGTFGGVVRFADGG